MLVRFVGRFARGGDHDDAGLLLAGELDEFLADGVRHLAAADDDERAFDLGGGQRRRQPQESE